MSKTNYKRKPKKDLPCDEDSSSSEPAYVANAVYNYCVENSESHNFGSPEKLSSECLLYVAQCDIEKGVAKVYRQIDKERQLAEKDKRVCETVVKPMGRQARTTTTKSASSNRGKRANQTIDNVAMAPKQMKLADNGENASGRKYRGNRKNSKALEHPDSYALVPHGGRSATMTNALSNAPSTSAGAVCGTKPPEEFYNNNINFAELPSFVNFSGTCATRTTRQPQRQDIEILNGTMIPLSQVSNKKKMQQYFGISVTDTFGNVATFYTCFEDLNNTNGKKSRGSGVKVYDRTMEHFARNVDPIRNRSSKSVQTDMTLFCQSTQLAHCQMFEMTVGHGMRQAHVMQEVQEVQEIQGIHGMPEMQNVQNVHVMGQTQGMQSVPEMNGVQIFQQIHGLQAMEEVQVLRHIQGIPQMQTVQIMRPVHGIQGMQRMQGMQELNDVQRMQEMQEMQEVNEVELLPQVEGMQENDEMQEFYEIVEVEVYSDNSEMEGIFQMDSTEQIHQDTNLTNYQNF